MPTIDVPAAMRALQEASPEGAQTYMAHKAAILENPQLQALSTKEKLLVGIGVAAALQSSDCALMWTKMARQAGASKDEVAEAILVARLMMMAVVNSAAADTFTWLNQEEGTGGGQ